MFERLSKSKFLALCVKAKTMLIFILILSIALNAFLVIRIMKSPEPTFEIDDLVIIEKSELVETLTTILREVLGETEGSNRKPFNKGEHYRVRSKKIPKPIPIELAVEIARRRDGVGIEHFILVKNFLPTKQGFYLDYIVPVSYVPDSELELRFKEFNFGMIAKRNLFSKERTKPADIYNEIGMGQSPIVEQMIRLAKNGTVGINQPEDPALNQLNEEVSSRFPETLNHLAESELKEPFRKIRLGHDPFISELEALQSDQSGLVPYAFKPLEPGEPGYGGYDPNNPPPDSKWEEFNKL